MSLALSLEAPSTYIFAVFAAALVIDTVPHRVALAGHSAPFIVFG